MDRLFRVGRIFKTGVAFATFALGGLVLTVLVLPVVRLQGPSQDEVELRVQRITQRAFGVFAAWMTFLNLIRVRFEGPRPGGSGPVIVVANHPTLIDVVLLISQMPQADCVVKKEAWSNPFMRGVLSAAGFIPNDGGVELVEMCAERIRAGRSVLLFPEGTRSAHRTLGPFRRGAARIALRAECPVQRVVIRCDPPALSKGEAWWQVPDRTPVYHIATHAPQRIDAVGVPPARAAREATNEMREWFLKQLSPERWSDARS